MHRALLLLRKIPKGNVTTYKILAEKCGTSPRAIGRVMASNKEPEKYPCYKVVKSSGEIGGYKGKAKGKSIVEKMALLKKDGIEIVKVKISKRHFWKF